MSHITLTEEQLSVLEAAQGPVEVRAPDGRIVHTFTPLTAQEREAIRVSKSGYARPGKRITSQQLLAVLKRAEEIDETEGMTPEKMAELLRRARAGEPL